MEKYFIGQPLVIDEQPQLLLDDYLVEDRWRLKRVLHKPSKFFHPILYVDKPWEGDSASRPYVIYDEEYGAYRMWYQCFSLSNYHGAGGPPYFVCYAESDDGINWHKPLLDVCPFPGYAKTNVVYSGTHYKRVQGVQVWRDEQEEDRQKRYKMICVERRPLNGKLQSGVSLAYSPDGFRWTLDPAGHILDYHSDCHNHVVFDKRNQRWLLYCRPIHLNAASDSQRSPLGENVGRRRKKRRVAAMTSKDFKQWSYPRTVMYPDEFDTPDYDSCTVFKYGSHFLMFYCAMEGDVTGTNEIRLASSSDGFSWHRFPTREPFIQRGGEQFWDHGQVMSTCPPVKQGERLLIYYSGTNRPQHDTARLGGAGVAFTKVGRFVEQQAGDEPGFLLTREMMLSGNRLRLNVAKRGMPYKEQYVKAEIVCRPQLGNHDNFEQAIPGFTLEDCDRIVADRTDILVTWNGNSDLSQLMDKPVYIRFELKNMGIFSFQIIKE